MRIVEKVLYGFGGLLALMLFLLRYAITIRELQ